MVEVNFNIKLAFNRSHKYNGKRMVDIYNESK
jgi:hypothetical protein